MYSSFVVVVVVVTSTAVGLFVDVVVVADVEFALT
jgi:hypothetical protein